MLWTRRISMKNHRFLWLRNRTTNNRKCEKARNIKEKRTIEMFSTASKPLVALRSSASDNLQLNNAKKARKYAIFRAFSMPEIAWFRWWNLRKFDFKLTHFDGFTMGLRPIFEPNGWENGFTEGHFGGEISPISLTDFRQKSGWNGMKNSVRFVWRVLTNSAKI